jgi:hypothetical protein
MELQIYGTQFADEKFDKPNDLKFYSVIYWNNT